MMIIRHFSIITATITTVLSDNYQFHCTECCNTQLNFSHTWKYQVFAICCHMLHQSWEDDHHLAVLESCRQTSDMKSQQDLGWVSKPAKLKDHIA